MAPSNEGHVGAGEGLRDLEELLRSAEMIAEGLVRLAPHRSPEFRRQLHELERILAAAHPDRWDRWLAADPVLRVPGAAAPELLQREHRIFPLSLEQLRWFELLVVRDDHGGNRQALGQYLRIFLEALDRHLADERKYEAYWAAEAAPRVEAGR
jgi:hypothetical protein